MTPENKIILIKRLKSLGWRLGSVVVVLLLNFVADNVGLFELPNSVCVIIGMVCSEITKQMNSKK